MLTGVSLFAGVGGFDLAMTRNGVKVVATVEIDKKCNEVLAKHFPEAKPLTGWFLRRTKEPPSLSVHDFPLRIIS